MSEQFDRPVCVTHYPAAIKAFYMKPDPNEPDKALCVDVLAPEGYGEIIGGGQRLDDLDLLLQRIKEHDLPQEAFEWYLDLRRYGSVPHGGFGMGIERCVSWICGLEHVRETIPYPRMLVPDLSLITDVSHRSTRRHRDIDGSLNRRSRRYTGGPRTVGFSQPPDWLPRVLLP